MKGISVLFEGIVPKESINGCEDCYLIDLERGIIALSDGASESYDSKTWSMLLTELFVRHPEVSHEWIDQAIEAYSSRYDRDDMSWSQQAAFDRGSFATLLGIEFDQDLQSVEVTAVGDSLLVLFDGDRIQKPLPYTNADEFKQKPDLLSTLKPLNGFMRKNGFYTSHTSRLRLTNLEEPMLLCMTDAIGAWLLREHASGNFSYRELLSIRTQGEFEDFIEYLRKRKKIRLDDSTLITVSVSPRAQEA